ncbi:DNA replication complex GINS PSF1 [Lecanosticta acicola]|uniref:DNA replication complex GINS protein PSF1 n=1 Tax=Lecanosticta acicola TaxID=111012 RepID=A0AAI8Z2D7_9PEZI|nr:DNA replication complex GINS PSF1 [Lecanosticta acicola]
MYGEQGFKLALDAKRTQNLAHLPPYAAIVVREACKEVRDLDRDTNTLLATYNTGSTQSSDGTQIKSSFNPADDPATACALLVNHLSMRRNKRCLMAYHKTRIDRLEQLAWEGKDVLEQASAGSSQAAGSNGATSSLSAEEEQYAHQYSDLLAAYKGQWTDIDLTGSLEPPKDIFIDVRVLKDAGEIQTEYGSITLTKNSQFYVRQGDVEKLIQQGYLQKLG